MSNTSDKIRENMKQAVEGQENSVTQQLSERRPQTAGRIGDVRGQNHLREAAPVGVAPDARLTGCRNFHSKAVPGESALHSNILGML